MIYKNSPSNFIPQFELVSCFFECDGKILLLHRHDNKSQGGRWGIPAGKVNSGESLLQAMVREIKEETGLEVEPEQLKYFDKVYVVHPEHQFIFHMFHLLLTELPQIQINSYEHQSFAWVTPHEACKIHGVMDLDACVSLFYKSSRSGSTRISSGLARK